MTARGIHRVRSVLSDGRERWRYYAWRGGPCIWTCDGAPVREPAPEAFQAAYKAALAVRHPKATEAHSPLSELIALFKAEAMPKLGADSRAAYDASFRLIEAKFGKARIKAFTEAPMRQDVKRWHKSFAAAPRAADMHLGALVRLLNYAKEEGFITGHCAEGIERLHEADRSHIVWHPDEIEAACVGASFSVALAIRFLAMTGMRRGAAAAVPLSADKGDRIEADPGKGGREAVIPVVSQLRVLLDEARRHRLSAGVTATTILFNADGRPWEPKALSRAIKRQCERAGVGAGKRVHDLRGTAATGFMAAGLSDEEIAEILGWRATDVREIRRRYVSRAAIVSAAIARLERGAK